MLEFNNVIMKIIKDLRILNAVGKRYNLEFDKKFKYITNDYGFIPSKIDLENKIYYTIEYNNHKYDIKYFDGCFNPYLVELV